MNSLWFTLLCFLICSTSMAIIITDDDTRLTYDRPYYPRPRTTTDASLDNEELSRRRHKRRRRPPCASSKVEPINNEPTDRTLLNFYYSDVDIGGATHYVAHGGGSGSSGCQSSVLGDSVDDYSNQRPQFASGFGTFLNSVFFGNNKPSGDSSPVVTDATVAEETGPLGGTVPNEVKYNRYNNEFNPKRFYRQLNRDVDRFLRPFYRLF